MQWEPEDKACQAYIKMVCRYNKFDRAGAIGLRCGLILELGLSGASSRRKEYAWIKRPRCFRPPWSFLAIIASGEVAGVLQCVCEDGDEVEGIRESTVDLQGTS